MLVLMHKEFLSIIARKTNVFSLFIFRAATSERKGVQRVILGIVFLIEGFLTEITYACTLSIMYKMCKKHTIYVFMFALGLNTRSMLNTVQDYTT